MCFKYNPAFYQTELKQSGYAHLKDVLSVEFVTALLEFYERVISDATVENTSARIAGKKRQYVFDFPSQEIALEFRSGIARLTGMTEEKITISERHLKVYDEATNPWPAPHKDRCASQISIGLPIALPKSSSVCVFPTMDHTANPNDKAMFLNQNDHADLDNIYQTEEAVMLNEKVGDLVLFNGSSIFHERVNAAGTAVLYIKINDNGDDPLGENIYSAQAPVLELA